MDDQDTRMLALSVEPMGAGNWRWGWYDYNSGKTLADGVEVGERAARIAATSYFVRNSDVVARAEAAEHDRDDMERERDAARACAADLADLRDAATARAEAAEQRAEALSAEVARLRTDALLLAGLANHRAVYEMDGHDAEALDVAAERADEAADGVVIDVIRRALWGEAASEQS